MIQEGQITVNDIVVTDPATQIDLEFDEVKLNNRPLKPVKRFQYILLNKPKGVVSTSSDERRRPTVVQLIDAERRMYPVGRLDINTTGLILLTDDGELSQRLTHPKYRVDKVYLADLHKPLKKEHEGQFLRGVEIGEGERIRARVKVYGEKAKRVELVVHEGKNRMLRRMFDSMGYKVTALDRTVYAGLEKKKLPRSGWRHLNRKEIDSLYKIVGLKTGH